MNIYRILVGFKTPNPVDNEHVTPVQSDGNLKSGREPCNVHTYSYCNECNLFMCHECFLHHQKCPFVKNHVIVRESKTQSPKYKFCAHHTRNWKDNFYVDDDELSSSTCRDIDNKIDVHKAMEDVNKTIPAMENNTFPDAIQNMEAINIIAVETKLDQLAGLMHKTKQLHEKIRSNVTELVQNLRSEIEYVTLKNKQPCENGPAGQQSNEVVARSNANPYKSKLPELFHTTSISDHSMTASLDTLSTELPLTKLSSRSTLASQKSPSNPFHETKDSDQSAIESCSILFETTEASCQMTQAKHNKILTSLTDSGISVLSTTGRPITSSTSIVMTEVSGKRMAADQKTLSSPLIPSGVSDQTLTVGQTALSTAINSSIFADQITTVSHIASSIPLSPTEVSYQTTKSVPMTASASIPATGGLGRSLEERQLTQSRLNVVVAQSGRQSSDVWQRRDDRQAVKAEQQFGNAAVMISASLRNIKATKQNQFEATLEDGAFITGIAVTKDKRILLVDQENCQVKVLSQDMKFLSYVSLPIRPHDIAVISNNTAIVTTDNKILVTLDISWRYWSYWMLGRQLSIRRTVALDYKVEGISSCNDKLVVTCPDTRPPSVKLIDQTGKVYWSVCTDKYGRKLFREPLYACCNDKTTTIVVTDKGTNKLILLNVMTGEVVTIRDIEGNKRPRGVTVDMDGNVYVCYYRTNGVSVLASDLTEERILLTGQCGLGSCPYAIAFEPTRRQLLVSYFLYNRVHCFQLS